MTWDANFGRDRGFQYDFTTLIKVVVSGLGDQELCGIETEGRIKIVQGDVG